MELKQLEIFLKVCQTMNITKAANELNYAQSNVTTHIKNLEKELNTPLFYRVNHKLFLTSKGQELIPYAKEILRLSNSALEQISEIKNSPVRIATSESLCIYELPRILQSFRKICPDVQTYFSLVNLSHDQYAEYLASEDIDFAFVLDTIITDSNLDMLYKEEVRVSLFASPDHELANKRELHLSDLENQSFLLTSSDCCYRKQFEQIMSEIPFEKLMETPSIQAIKEMACSGVGLCLLPDMTTSKEIQQGLLVRLPIDLNITLYSQIFTLKDKWISSSAKGVLERMIGRG